ncbi:MAG: hypothetical protein Q4F74_07430 [Synergistaceae bacterium]|nr:hypothetical protein [Synergistaceae bacterium]
MKKTIRCPLIILDFWRYYAAGASDYLIQLEAPPSFVPLTIYEEHGWSYLLADVQCEGAAAVRHNITIHEGPIEDGAEGLKYIGVLPVPKSAVRLYFYYSPEHGATPAADANCPKAGWRRVD